MVQKSKYCQSESHKQWGFCLINWSIGFLSSHAKKGVQRLMMEKSSSQYNFTFELSVKDEESRSPPEIKTFNAKNRQKIHHGLTWENQSKGFFCNNFRAFSKQLAQKKQAKPEKILVNLLQIGQIAKLILSAEVTTLCISRDWAPSL